MTPPPPVDWPSVVGDLRGNGMSLAAIGKSLGAAAQVVMRWGDGTTSPNDTNGERLILLWVERTGQSRERVPRGIRQPH